MKLMAKTPVMGLFGTLTDSTEGIIILLLIASLFSGLILWLVFGGLLFVVLFAVFWEALLPGLVVLLGLITMFWWGVKNGENRWVIGGFLIIVAGICLATYFQVVG